MAQDRPPPEPQAFLALAARRAEAYRTSRRSLIPSASAETLRDRFCLPLDACGHPGAEVIDELIAAAEPGLVGNTDPNFFAWVMGGSNLVGVAADWLTAAWGQNAAIYQASPASAIAEEAVEAWLLDLLDLPRESSVGFVNGATMAAFVGLSAARSEVLRRCGHDFEFSGLQSAPLVRVFLSEDAHVTNFSVLRQLGFGEANFHRLPSDAAGLMRPADLARAMAGSDGPKIVLAQAGHINSGGFEPLEEIAEISRKLDAWLHVDGAFGLWARASSKKKSLAAGADLADSWSIDGHKWLQIPYDSGFAIVRDRDAHSRAMKKSAGYLNSANEDGRNPSDYTPSLSRRANGFAAWAVIRNLGRRGIAEIVDRHCASAALLADRVRRVEGLEILNDVALNQVVIGCEDRQNEEWKIQALADGLNADHGVFVKTARWKERCILRFSVISGESTGCHVEKLASAITELWPSVAACATASAVKGALHEARTSVA